MMQVVRTVALRCESARERGMQRSVSDSLIDRASVIHTLTADPFTSSIICPSSPPASPPNSRTGSPFRFRSTRLIVPGFAVQDTRAQGELRCRADRKHVGS